jgi:FtsH-binding integral membrane protein
MARKTATSRATDRSKEIGMKLFRTKVWSVLDIGLLKWCCILTGMIVGAYLTDFTKRHVWVFVIAAVALAIKPTISYFGEEENAR